MLILSSDDDCHMILQNSINHCSYQDNWEKADSIITRVVFLSIPKETWKFAKFSRSQIKYDDRTDFQRKRRRQSAKYRDNLISASVGYLGICEEDLKTALKNLIISQRFDKRLSVVS